MVLNTCLQPARLQQGADVAGLTFTGVLKSFPADGGKFGNFVLYQVRVLI